MAIGTSDTDITAVGDADVKALCVAAGEQMLWASLVDTRLNKPIRGVFALPDHVMIEPIVARLDARRKAELLKTCAKLITQETWRARITRWVKRAVKADAKRSIVARHGMRVEDGKVVLYRDRLAKVIAGLDMTGGTLAPPARMGARRRAEGIRMMLSGASGLPIASGR